MVARAFKRAGADQDALVNDVLKIARCRGARGAGDRNVILGAQTALEVLHSLAEDPVGGSGLICELFVNH